MPQFTASQNTSSQTKKREPHRTHLRQNTAMKQAQPYKPARDDKVKAPPPRLTFVTKTDNPYQLQQKPANIAENTKKNREKTGKSTVKSAPTTETKHSNQSSKNRGATAREADKNNNR